MAKVMRFPDKQEYERYLEKEPAKWEELWEEHSPYLTAEEVAYLVDKYGGVKVRHQAVGQLEIIMRNPEQGAHEKWIAMYPDGIKCILSEDYLIIPPIKREIRAYIGDDGLYGALICSLNYNLKPLAGKHIKITLEEEKDD